MVMGSSEAGTGGSLGFAKGHIVIDTTSVDAALQVARAAAAEFTKIFDDIGKAMQGGMGGGSGGVGANMDAQAQATAAATQTIVNAINIQKEALTQETAAAKVNADGIQAANDAIVASIQANAKSIQDAAKTVIDSLGLEGDQAEATANRIKQAMQDAAKIGVPFNTPNEAASYLINQNKSNAAFLNDDTKGNQAQNQQIAQEAAAASKQQLADNAAMAQLEAGRLKVKEQIVQETLLENKQNALLLEAEAKAVRLEEQKAEAQAQSQQKQMLKEFLVQADIEDASVLQQQLRDEEAMAQLEAQRLTVKQQMVIERINENKQAAMLLETEAKAAAAEEAAAAPRIQRSTRIGTNLLPLGFVLRDVGAEGASNAVLSAGSSLQLIELLPFIGENFQVLQNRLKDMPGVLGSVAKGLSSATLFFGEVGSALLTVGIIAAPIIIAVLALGAAFKAQEDQQKANEKAAKDYTDQLKKEVEERQRIQQLAAAGNVGNVQAQIADVQNQRLTEQTGVRDQAQAALNGVIKSLLEQAFISAQQTASNTVGHDINLNNLPLAARNQLIEEEYDLLKSGSIEFKTYNQAVADSNAKLTAFDAQIKVLNESALAGARAVAELNRPIKEAALSRQYANAAPSEAINQIAQDYQDSAAYAKQAELAQKQYNDALLAVNKTTDETAKKALIDQATAFNTSRVNAQVQSDESAADAESLTKLLPLIEARYAETEAMAKQQEAIQQAIDNANAVAQAIAGGDPNAVLQQIAGLQANRDRISTLQQEPAQAAFNTESARLRGLAQAAVPGSDPASQAERNAYFTQLTESDGKYLAAAQALQAANDAVDKFTGTIGDLATGGLNGAQALYDLNAPSRKQAIDSQYGESSSKDINKQIGKDTQDAANAADAYEAALAAENQARVDGNTGLANQLEIYRLQQDAIRNNKTAEIQELQVLGPLAKAREDEADAIKKQLDAIQQAISHDTDLAERVRKETVDGAADRLYGINAETSAIEAQLPQLKALAGTSDDAAKAYQAAKDRLTELGQETQDEFQVVIPAAIKRATDELTKDLQDMIDQSAQRVADIMQAEADKEADAKTKLDDALKATNEKAQEDALKQAQDYNDKRAKLERDYNRTFLEAVADRDAVAADKATIKYHDDLNDLNDANDKQTKDRQKAYEKERKNAQDQYDKTLADAKRAADRQIAQEQQKLQREEAARIKAYNDQLAQLNVFTQNGTAQVGTFVNNVLDGLSVIAPYAKLMFDNLKSYIDAAARSSSSIVGSSSSDSDNFVDSKLNRYASGTNYLPQTGRIIAEQGEAILDPQTSQIIRNYLGNFNGADLIHAVSGSGSHSAARELSDRGTQIHYNPIVSVSGTSIRQAVEQAIDRMHKELNSMMREAGFDV